MPITPHDVRQVSLISDPAERNRAVTRGYWELSQRFRTYFPDEITWPGLAVWASSQAGRTIRKEDLLRRLERKLGDSPAVRQLVQGPLKLSAKFVLEKVLELDPFSRSANAVSRANLKVYSEIGLHCAEYLDLLGREGGAGDWILPFLDTLRGGAPPDGQDDLKLAFASYHQALRLPAGRLRSQYIFHANASIGVHEQTRLQPEIEESLVGAALDGLEVKDRLVDLLFPVAGPIRTAAVGMIANSRLLEPVLEDLRRLVREVLTETMMVFELPGGVYRLSEDIPGDYPPNLDKIDLPECEALLASVDSTPNSLEGTGARDWANFPQRMHFIADLFRLLQNDERLFGKPEDIR